MINVDTTGIELTNRQEVMFRRLFEYLLHVGLDQRVKGNVVIPFNGEGNYGQVKVEHFVDVAKGGD